MADSDQSHTGYKLLHRNIQLPWPRKPIASHGRGGELQVAVSEPILNETMRVLREEFAWDGYRIADARQKILAFAEMV